MVYNKNATLQWHALYFMLRAAMITYLNYTLC